ncbi:MAG: UbiA family prenyltransferase [Planctomycetes bacterium]|nr:UbiA family prenyltransferase [Planctomycetota bacterium]
MSIRLYLSLVRFPHTIFALPFAVMSACLAAQGFPDWRTLLWIGVAMVAARSAAMAWNRLVDRHVDARNPRTAGREIPAGKLRPAAVLVFTIAMSGLFVVAAGMLNRTALVLSPAVLAVLLGYSYAKRFTALCHFWLGAALGLSPLGAWVAVVGDRAWSTCGVPLLLGAAVLLWTAGFDILYACQDVDVDRREGLHSIPRALGIAGSLRLSSALHALMVALLVLVGSMAGLGIVYGAGIVVVAALLAYEHWIVTPRDLSKLNVAFFTVNGYVSLLFMVFTLLDLFVRRGP